MLRHHVLAASGIALSAFLAVVAPVMAQNSLPAGNGANPSEHVDANGLPTTHSTPAEHAQTESLNGQVAAHNQAADAQADANQAQGAANNAQYQQQQQQYSNAQQQYQNQLQQNQAAHAQYQDQRASYDALRGRYAAERAAYHRGVWPVRYREWRLHDDAHLIGSRVEIVNGDHVGTVDGIAHTASGHVDGLHVTLDGGKQVWIDEADVRFDTAGGVVMTNLDRGDLRQMSDERL